MRLKTMLTIFNFACFWLISLSSIAAEPEERKWGMKDVLTEVVLKKEWKDLQPVLSRSYSNVEKFLQAIFPEDQYEEFVNKLDKEKLTHLFYLIPYKKSEKQQRPYDLNVLRVWAEDGNFGQGVKIAIIGDNVDTTHSDLVSNVNEESGYEHVDTQPPSTSSDNNTIFSSVEGSYTAGLISAKMDEQSCSIGIAPQVTLVAVQLTDISEPENMKKFAKAMTNLRKTKNADIILNLTPQMYSLVTKPEQELIDSAYLETEEEGRDEKGIIHIVPVGDESIEYACAHNVNVNYIFTIGVAAVEYDGSKNKNSAQCAAVMVSAFSTDGKNNPDYDLYTANVDGKCDKMGSHNLHTETAASFVAGVVALALKANPNLTFRDVQHLIAWTSEVSGTHSTEVLWRKNKAGFYVSPSYGFGIINAYNLVKMAKTFKTVPPIVRCNLPFGSVNTTEEKPSFGTLPRHLSLYVYGCNTINYVEHVQLKIAMEKYRGAGANIELISPWGTSVPLMKVIKTEDVSPKTYKNWIFDSVVTWGESAKGVWSVKIFDEVENSSSNRTGRILNLTLHIYGTKTAPKHYCKFAGLCRNTRPYMMPTPWLSAQENKT